MDPPSNTKQRKRRRRLRQNFTSYISFGIYSTICAGGFLCLYLLLLIGLLPLLTTDLSGINDPVHDGHNRNLARLNEQEKQVIGDMGSTLKKRFEQFRNFRGVTDQSLKNAVLSDFKPLRDRKNKANTNEGRVHDQVPAVPGRRAGFMVVGMHRSGTSMLSGLLVQGLGYNVGGPLIGAHFDNQKGFFERIDAVLQNDEFMKSQHVWWSAGVVNYDGEKAYNAYKAGVIRFDEGKKALDFLNDPNNAPWMQKDPRMCITLKTWLPLLNTEPAILFTYRHPLEVALSLQHREKFHLEQGLRLWIVYNMRAIQNSKGLCRVYSSNDAILANPLEEVQRLSDELTSKCGLPAPSKKITQDDVDAFIDPNMQHGKKEMGQGKDTLAEIDGCVIPEYDSQEEEGTPGLEREQALYKVAMQIHCAFKSGAAYEDGYVFPELPH